MVSSNLKTASFLSILIAVLAGVASAAGLLSSLYRDNAFVTAAWRGNDLVTLFVVVPVLLVTLCFARRGALPAQLTWLGTLVYMLYNYSFYLFGAAFNACFWVYVALFTLSLYALIFSLPRLDAAGISRRFSTRTPVGWIGGFMLFFALLLGGLWLARSADFFVTGQPPQDILRTEHPTAIVYALDWSLLLPALLLSGVWLMRRRPWGFILATVMMVKASAYGLVLLVMSLYASLVNGAGDALVGLWAFLTAGCAACLITLLLNIQPAHAASPAGGALPEPAEGARGSDGNSSSKPGRHQTGRLNIKN